MVACRAASHLLPPATCISATCARRSPPGSRRAAPGAGSSCGWRTSIGPPRRPSTRRASWPTWRRSASTGTGRSCARASASTSTGRRSSACATRAWCTRATARAARSGPRSSKRRRGAACPPSRRRLPRNVPRAQRTPSAPARERAGRRPALRLRTNGEVIELRRRHRRAVSPAPSTTSCSPAPTACPPTTWQWSSTTPTRA